MLSLTDAVWCLDVSHSMISVPWVVGSELCYCGKRVLCSMPKAGWLPAHVQYR